MFSHPTFHPVVLETPQSEDVGQGNEGVRNIVHNHLEEVGDERIDITAEGVPVLSLQNPLAVIV